MTHELKFWASLAYLAVAGVQVFVRKYDLHIGALWPALAARKIYRKHKGRK